MPDDPTLPRNMQALIGLNAPQPTFDYDPRKPKPAVGPPVALPGHDLDFIRGLFTGSNLGDPNESGYALAGDAVQNFLPLLKGMALLKGGLKLVRGADVATDAVKGAKAGVGIMEVAPDVLAKAKALYQERGAGNSSVRLARALMDAGHKFGPMRTAAEKRAANAYVNQLLGEVETTSNLAADSPFAKALITQMEK